MSIAGSSSSNNTNGSAGTANTGGGGGGGSSYNGDGGNGGSGIVILRTKAVLTVGSGLTYSTNKAGEDTVYSFTAGTGTVTVG